MVKLTALMNLSRSDCNSFASFLFKPKYTKFFLSIFKISPEYIIDAFVDLIF